MSDGYVYVLSNEAMPGLVKIGRSKLGGRHRASQMYTTGVPARFRLEFEIFVDDCAAVELAAHKALNRWRASESREFFRVDPCEAIRAVLAAFADTKDLLVVHPEEVVMPEDVHRYTSILNENGYNVHPFEVSHVMGHMLEWESVAAAYKEYIQTTKSARARPN